MAYARNKTALTIGLDTIMRKKDATIIIIAAGEGKAPMVAHAIENKDIHYPAATLQAHAGTRFYLTRAAASHLNARYLATVKKDAQLLQDHAAIDRILTGVSLSCNKPLLQLTADDCMQTEDGALLIQKTDSISQLTRATHDRYLKKLIPNGPKNKSILHTAPHHDDIMLGYLPYLVRLMREGTNIHYFNYLTSGFNAVTNKYMLKEVQNANDFLLKNPDFKYLLNENYFDPLNTLFRDRDVYQYLDGIADDIDLAPLVYSNAFG